MTDHTARAHLKNRFCARASKLPMLFTLVLSTLLYGCSSGGGGPAPTYTVGGSVSGLASGATLVLQNNGVGTLNVTGNGSYQFETPLTTNTAYNVTILTQPNNHSCQISGGSGTVAAQAVTTITISCTLDPSYTLGGSVSGLSTGNLVVQKSSGSTTTSHTLSANGPYTLDGTLFAGSTYSVTIPTQPNNHSCQISNGSGTVANANISNIDISCAVIATGYYSGNATVKADNDTDPLAIPDLKAMVNGDRLMLMSNSQNLLYDGLLTITGSSYTGTVTIYKAGSKISTTAVTISGTLVGGSSIEGTLAGTGAGNGTFTLSYGQSNDTLASYGRIETTYRTTPGTGTWWGASVGDGGPGGFGIKSDGNRFVSVSSTAPDQGLIRYCDYHFTSSVVPVANSALYAAEIELYRCDAVAVDGTYTGLATLLSVGGPDDTLLLAFTYGEYGFFAEYKIITW